MAIPIIASKLTAPPVPAAYLSRPRLDRRWPEWSAGRLVAVTAGAGFGKTLFLADQARRHPGGLLWYSLDGQDADPETFCAYLLDGLRGLASAPSGGRTARPDPGAVSPGAEEALARAIGYLHDAPPPALIMLDDAHTLAGAPQVLQWIERLVRFLPATATLVISAREPLAIPATRLKAAGQAARIGAADLSFTAEETAQLFERRFPGTRLAGDSAHRLAELTEGWAVGIELFLQSLPDGSPETVSRALEQVSASGERWFDYFAEEVVAGLCPRTRDFLRRSALLPRLEVRLCNRLLGIRHSGRTLEELARRQLFTFPVDGERRQYRYHHLFRDFLRRQLEQRTPATELRRLHRRAAAALAEGGSLADAVALHADAGDHQEALRLIERGGDGLLEAGQHAAVERAFDGLPDDQFRRRPAALRVLGRLRDYQGQWREAESIYDRLVRRLPRGAERAELLRRMASLRLRRGEYETGTALCRRALRELGRRADPRRGEILLLLGVAACEQGRLAEGERHLNEAAALFERRRSDLPLIRIAYLLAANVYYPRGEFARAKAAARRALVGARRAGDAVEVSRAVGVLAFVTAAAGEAREARELATEGLRLATAFQHRHAAAFCRQVLGRCALLAGDLSAARQHLDQAQQFGDQAGETDLVLYPRLGRVELALVEGDPSRAAVLAAEALRIARAQEDALQEGQCRALLGLAERDARPRPASRQWSRAEEIFRRIGAAYELHRLLLLRLASGDVPATEARRTLRELLLGTGRLGHDFLFEILEPDRGALVAARALAEGVEPERARALLLRLGEKAVPPLAELARSAPERVRSQAIELLSRIGGRGSRAALDDLASSKTAIGRLASRAVEDLGRSPAVPLSIEALGPLVVRVGDRVLAHADWRSRRARRLFELLLAHRFRWAPRDQILEALWPDADPDRAHNNLRQSVHILRALLEPDRDRAGHSHYIVCRDEAFRLQPGEGYAYDVEAFERGLAEAEALSERGVRSPAEEKLKQAIGLYRGDFLAQSPYEEFAVAEREELRDRLLRALRRLLESEARAGRWEEWLLYGRRATTLDPYDEAIAAGIVRAHLRLGHRREALAAYQAYERMMIRELGVLPSAEMRALADEAAQLGARPTARGRARPADQTDGSDGGPCAAATRNATAGQSSLAARPAV
ncbi:MAG: winged helix-turn-helix domain-containing protein [Candidatus Eisenbacteria bacterium]|uniref:Winged helix-turn-helix domain-containing protein n=1 Tax=Eiseniibacteriota bacterium TaxID=2212470 RepID=A0A937X9U2_UNCEI|nr:winged helix-turn-helix domain-containing protein [Candidatus Eisenbacteria bacterium]